MPEADVIPIKRDELERLKRDAEDGRFANLPSIQARVDRMERWRTNHRFGDIGGPQLTQLLDSAARGDVADYAELVEFAITTEPHILSLYVTRNTRVAQADYIVAPCKYGNPRQAELAAEFCDEQMGRMQGVQNAFCELLHAIALGYSASEMLWARDAVDRVNYVEKLVHRHSHRFRYDLQWQLRLYDQGHRRGPASAEGYGEMLDPRTWVVHTNQEVAGYPGIGGVMRACLWRWMFARWVEKFRMAYIEKYGGPFVYARVPKGTPAAARDRLLLALERLTSEHAAVLEMDGEIVMQAAAAAAQSDEIHDRYQTKAEASWTKAFLGHADAVDPGAHGSQAAVSTRASATMDPRMVSDGVRLGETWRATVFTRLLRENAHQFDAPIGRMPVPDLRLKTADDEVKRDESDLAEEQAAEGELDENGMPYEVQGEDDEPGDVEAQAEAPQVVVVQTPGNPPPTPPPPPRKKLGASPKAKAPGSTRGRTAKTARTSSRLPSPLALALRGELVGWGSSSSKASRTRLKR